MFVVLFFSYCGAPDPPCTIFSFSFSPYGLEHSGPC
jgi:hypothetical protein